MPGPLPSPTSQRTNKGHYKSTALPADGRTGPPPELPPLRPWHPLTIEAWRQWWSTPQAVLWDQSGRSLHRWAILFDTIVADPAAGASVHAQLLALEDRHGFSPQALAKLRWSIAAADAPAAPSKPTTSDRRRRVLEVAPDAS